MSGAVNSSSSPGFMDKIKSQVGGAVIENLDRRPVITGIALAAIGIMAILGMAHLSFLSSISVFDTNNLTGSLTQFAIMGGVGLGSYLLFSKLAKKTNGKLKTLFTFLQYVPLIIIGGIFASSLAGNFINLNEELSMTKLILPLLAGAAGAVGIATLIIQFVSNKKALKAISVVGVLSFFAAISMIALHFFQNDHIYSGLIVCALARPGLSVLEAVIKALKKTQEERRAEQRIAAAHRHAAIV